MKYVFYKQKRIIKIDDSKLWVGGEIEIGQYIIVRRTRLLVKSVVTHGNMKVITLTDTKD